MNSPLTNDPNARANQTQYQVGAQTTQDVTADTIITKLEKEIDVLTDSRTKELSDKDAEMLLSTATLAANDPQLPPGDQMKLAEWISSLSLKTLIDPTTGKATDKPINQFWQPSILAIIAPILGEIAKVMISIEKQSAKLEVNMMKLVMSTAQSIYDQTVAAGKAKSDQLDAEMKMHIAGAVQGFLGGAVAIAGLTGGLIKSRSANAEIQNNYRNPNTGELPKPGTPKYQEMKDAEMRSNQKIVTEIQVSTEAIKSLTSGAVETFDAVQTALKKGATMDEAYAQALSSMLDKVIQIFSDTMRKASEAGKGASDYIGQIQNLVSQFAQTMEQINRG